MTCKCKVVHTKTNRHKIKRCALHENAENLLDVCKKVILGYDKGPNFLYCNYSFLNFIEIAIEKAEN